MGDNLGNTRNTFSTKTGIAVSTQQDDYYPFGMEISRNVLNPKNEYLYNKKELQEELQEYDYGARFYDPVIGRFTTVDKFNEKYSSMTPYQYAGNNPVLLIDLHGDSVSVDKSITSNKQANKDFNNFANSKAGRKFLSQYAAKGQKIGGYTFKKSGKYNDKGIDVNYKLGNTGTLNTLGQTDHRDEYGQTNIVNGRLKEEVTLDYSKVPGGLKGNDLSMQMTQTIIHESLIHVDLDTKDFIDNGQMNGSNLTGFARKIFLADPYNNLGTAQHQQSIQDFNSGKKGGYFDIGMEILQSINEKLQTSYSVQKLQGLLTNGVSN